MIDILSQEFEPYGCVHSITADMVTELTTVTNNLPMPSDGCYVANGKSLSKTKAFAHLKALFGGMPIQTGYCFGYGTKLNALEYHKSSEIIFASTDMILLLGKLPLGKDNSYDSKNVKAFKVKAGTLLELYATTLHYAPLATRSDGFRAVIVLPLGTNTPLDKKIVSDDKTLWQTNKWLIAHPEETALEKAGAVMSIKGDNINIQY